MHNALSIDVEDYFQVQAFAGVISPNDWAKYECRVERNTSRILDILNESGGPPLKATFFILGWIAERYPGLVRKIRDNGHEIACHGYAHRLIYEQSREEFREDVRKAKLLLEDITGEAVIGYRAPSYSITSQSLWALEVLMDLGFEYDSSIFPIRHDFYGIPAAPRFPFTISLDEAGHANFSETIASPSPVGKENLELKPVSSLRGAARRSNLIVEFPITTLQMGNLNLPISGGGYFRLLPYSLTKMGLNRINEREHQPFVFYLHPWELDPDQPRIANAGARSRFRHYLNLDKTEARFRQLLKDFTFAPIQDVLHAA